MNVLFVGKRFYTNRDALIERYGRIFQIPSAWTRAGIATRLWLLDYHTNGYVREDMGGLDVVSTPLRSLQWMRHWHRISRSAATNRPDVVVASGDCYLGLLAYRLARRLRTRFVFDVYDKYDEFGGYRRLPGFDPFAFLLRRADACLFASRALMASLGIQCRHSVLVPNGVDTERFRPLDKSVMRRQLGLPEGVSLVGYFGSMEPDRGINDLIAAVSHLRERGQTVELLLGGRLAPGIQIEAPGVRYVGNVDFDKVGHMLAACDALAVPYRLSGLMDAGASNKIAEAMACGRPIIATRTPNLVANFPDQAAQLASRLAEPGDAIDLARVMNLQLSDPVHVDMPKAVTWQAIASELATELGLSASAPPCV